MNVSDLKIGLYVQFHSLKNGNVVGLEKDIYKIIDINFNDWESCDILLECNDKTIFTNHSCVEIAIFNYIQLSIFDFI